MQPPEVRAALVQRPLAPDVAVLVACAIIYALVAHGVVGRVSRNFPWSGGTDSIAAVAATIGAAVVVSVLAVMVGEWLAISIEIARVGNGHLSYRTGRVPVDTPSHGAIRCGYRALPARRYATSSDRRWATLWPVSARALKAGTAGCPRQAGSAIASTWSGDRLMSWT